MSPKHKSKKINQRNRQQQKLKRKTLLLIAAGGMSLMIIGLAVFFQVHRADQSMAAASTYMIVDEDPVTEKTLDAPILRQLPVIGPNTQFERPLKVASKDHQNQSH